MSGSLGDFDASSVIYTKFTTYRPSTGAPYTLAGTPAVSVYKDNSTTQSTSGVTLTADFDSVTGLNHLAIDTSSDGTFYAAGSFFDAVITTGTVDSVSAVGTVVARFTIRKNSALKPTTAGRTLVVDANGLADANTVKVGPSGSGTAQTAGDIIGDTNDIQTRLPAALVSGRMDSSVGAMAANVITAAATAADFTTEVTSGLSTLDAAGVRSAVGLASANLDTQLSAIDDFIDTEVAAILAAVDTEVAAIKAKTDNLPASPAATGDAMALTSAAVDAIIDDAVDGSVTLRQMLRGFAAALLGKASGLATTTAVYRDVNDTKDRITATVDADGNRTAITLDLT